jgi:type IV secretory pathway TraG/TraD family ATPase VirD4
MKWIRYVIGTFLCYIVVAIFTFLISGFVLLHSWGLMENSGVLRTAQGGNIAVVMSNLFLLAICFLLTYVYTLLKRSESPYIYGPIVGLIITIPTFSNYYIYNMANKVPAWTLIQNVLGFTLGFSVFKKVYYGKWF